MNIKITFIRVTQVKLVDLGGSIHVRKIGGLTHHDQHSTTRDKMIVCVCMFCKVSSFSFLSFAATQHNTSGVTQQTNILKCSTSMMNMKRATN